METKTAEEIMIPIDDYPCVQQRQTIREAIEVFETSQIEVGGRKSLPRVVLVFDEKDDLVGMVRRRDIFRGLEPKFLVDRPLHHRKSYFAFKVDPNLAELAIDKDRVAKEVKEQANIQVGEIMKPIKETVEHNDHIVKVMYEMVDNNLSLIPVLKDGIVIGVVRSVEALFEVGKFILEEK